MNTYRKIALIVGILFVLGTVAGVLSMLVGTASLMFGYELPSALYIPYVPFELVVGIWIAVKGIPETQLS